MATLSVVVPTYNASGYLNQVLQAIVDQSFEPLEVIVIDDGSTDNSVEVIEEFSRRASVVRLLRNERNMGVVFTAHRGLQAAVGDYAYFASTSDRVFPGFFEKSMELLVHHPQAALSCSDFVLFYSQGPQIVYRLGWAENHRFLSPYELVKTIKRKGEYIPGATCITKRSVLLESGGFIPELGGISDWFNSLVSGFRHGICFIPEPLAAFRMGVPDSVSATDSRWPKQRKALQDLFTLLGSEKYQDVASQFRASAALSCLPHILRALLSDPARWRYLSPKLVQRALWIALRRALVLMTPMVVKNQLLRLRRLIRAEEPYDIALM